MRTFGMICMMMLGPALARGAGEQQDPAWEQIRRLAEAQHEIVVLTIRQNNFNQVLPEMRKVFALRIPERYESTLSQEIEIVADALMHKAQYMIAHQILDEGLVSLKANKNKAAVLKKKAYILKKQGKEEEALEFFRQSVALESAH